MTIAYEEKERKKALLWASSLFIQIHSWRWWDNNNKKVALSDLGDGCVVIHPKESQE